MGDHDPDLVQPSKVGGVPERGHPELVGVVVDHQSTPQRSQPRHSRVTQRPCE
jgi:hypothetical protein